MSDREVLVAAVEKARELAWSMGRRDIIPFAFATYPNFQLQPFHRVYYTLLDKFAHGLIKKLIISVPPQHGKALQVDTPVLTTKGWKRHGDLCAGDYVFGADGKPRMVKGNSGSYRWHSKRVSFADGFSLDCAFEHEWLIYSDHDDHKGRVEELKEAQEIFGRRHRRKPYIKADAVTDMPYRELPIDPYLLGLWLGDGYSRSGNITSGAEDVEYYRTLPYFSAIYERQGNYILHTEGLSRTLRLHNLILNKHIPIEYLLASREQRMELLRGLMDTDGCIDTRGTCEFCQKEGRLAGDVFVLLRTLGFKPTRHTYKAKLYGKDCGNKVRITFNPDKGERIFGLARKQARLGGKTRADRQDKKKFFINSVDTIEDCEVNCIEVEGGMYLAGKELVPTHNSVGSSRVLPAFLLGLNPDCKISISSYSATIAESFSRDVQRIMTSTEYANIFPNTRLLHSDGFSVRGERAKQTDKLFEVVGARGYLTAVGRGGSLTSKTIDVSILDDVYSGYAEANSPVVRQGAWDWYTSVVRTRLHNNSRELIVFTRWHEEDIIGRLEQSEQIVDIHSWKDLEDIEDDAWVRLNFQALKTGEPYELDPREKGEALWPEMHSKESLEATRRLDPDKFECLHQGNPGSGESHLYHDFKCYVDKDDWGTLIRKGCCIDVADEGTDDTVSITYEVRKSSQQIFNEQKRRFEPLLFALVTDIIDTDENMDITEVIVPAQINREGVQRAWIEANNGGSGFEKVVRRKVRCETRPFTQHGNKESRIITNAAGVNNQIIMPFGWEDRYPSAYKKVMRFLRDFSANDHDDLPDCLTLIYEKELMDGNIRPYNHERRGVRVAN